MKKIAAVLLAVPMVVGAAGGERSEISRAARKKAFLEKEIALAKTPELYVVIDFDEKVVDLKARGARLKRWNIARSKTWGRAVELRISKIRRKSTLFPPKRANITPKPGEESQDVELNVLELAKMPAYYSIYLDENVRLKVRPKTKNVPRWIWNAGTELGWYLFLPLKTVWMGVSKKRFTEIEIVTMNEKEAKGIYWAFFEGLSCLIYNPGR